jgi:hypothetical protein
MLLNPREMTTQEYSFTLRNDKIRFYNRISWLILIINYAFLLYLALFADEKAIRNKSIASLVFTILVLSLFFYFRKAKYAFRIQSMFFLLVFSWISNEKYWIAATMMVFYFLNIQANKKPVVFFTQKNIRYPSFFYRIIEWRELNNAMLKDGLLTIDFKNNKIIQQLVLNETTNEQEFNEFCSRCLTSQRASDN